MYLPQFHRIPENDEWWGEGYTEWTAVKDAQVYHKGQRQPRVPMGENYYNILNKRTMEWQAQLMHEYDIDGMCFYHYYFKHGRKVLEKPAENLLKWKDIDMPFCFSWANETWARSWSKLSEYNSWSSKIDSGLEMNEEHTILLEQAYGEHQDWREHFDYLHPFFEDERYIKVAGKPVFIIYSPSSIPCLTKMILAWREFAKEKEYQDLYVVGVNCEYGNIFDGVLLQEPQNSIRKIEREKVIDNNIIWEKILNYQPNHNTFLCGFPGYDDTPRRGEGGCVVSEIAPKQFEDYMTELIIRARDAESEFIFINAWNEWGEGMYLEPDTVNENKLLLAVKNAKNRSLQEKSRFPKRNKLIENDERLITRYQNYWKILDKWLSLLEDGTKIEQYFLCRDIHHIAVYGLGMLGNHLVSQLEESQIVVDYGIDRRGNDIKRCFPVYTPESLLPKTELVIVTVTNEFADIYEELNKQMDCEIVSLDEVLSSLLSEIVI